LLSLRSCSGRGKHGPCRVPPRARRVIVLDVRPAVLLAVSLTLLPRVTASAEVAEGPSLVRVSGTGEARVVWPGNDPVPPRDCCRSRGTGVFWTCCRSELMAGRSVPIPLHRSG